MTPGQKIKIKRNYRPFYPGCPVTVNGTVVYSNEHFFTVRTRGGYCESFNHVDFTTGVVEVA